MMKQKYILILLAIFLAGCSQVKKKNSKSDVQVVSVKRLAFQKPDNWADKFYSKTIFKVRNPKLLQNYQQMDGICKGSEFDFVTDYQATEPYPIKFKKEMVTIATRDGFSKKVYVSKGVCRELALLKAPKTSKEGNIRINIKELNILYIYNYGSFVKDITFRTAFDDVEFFVE